MEMNLAQAPDDVLTSRLYELRRQERQLLVEFLAYLAEVGRRKLYLALGFPSLFAFCTDHLGLSSSSAFRRTTAARMLGPHPVIGEYLADGRLCLTTLVVLRDVLDETAEPRSILDRAAGRSEDQVKSLVAALRPQPAPPELFRLLPTKAPAALPLPPPTAAPAVACAAPPKLTPISDELRVLRITVDRAFADDLARVKSALSHDIPDGDLARVLHVCIRATLEAHEKRRRGTGKAAPCGDTRPRPWVRYVAAAVRDEVWRRDDGCCAFVGEQGRRCGSRHQLEVHHIVPFARGGLPTVDNLQLLCAQHNRYAAEKDYGAAHVRAKVAQSG